MRLTLRTLLAYLDDVLDSADKEELAQKIQSSEFAEDLVHRTRDTVRRLRLSAPQVIGTGMGLDPNTVAEYLDNVMPPEQVGDFERICLESDVHLAEASACHHVLTMILGEPADVDPIARRRMYSIATESADRKRIRIEPAHTTPTAAPPADPILTPLPPAPTELPASLRPHAVEVPDYLRAGAWWRSTGAVVALAALLLIGITIVFATGLRGWLGSKNSPEPMTAQNNTPSNDSSAAIAPRQREDSQADPADVAVAPKSDSTLPKPLAGPPQPMTPGLPPMTAATPSTPTNPAASTAGSPASQPDRYAVANNSPNPANPTPTTPTTGTDSAVTAVPQNDVANVKPESNSPAGAATPPANTIAALPAAPPLAAPTLPIPITSADSNSKFSPPPPDATTTSVPPPTTAAASKSGEPMSNPEVPVVADANAKQAASTAPPDSGTYLGGKTVLLRYDDKTGHWFRVDPRAAIIPGERVIALPEFRPEIALISGVHLVLSGGTQLVMGGGKDSAPVVPADLEYIPTIEVNYGRIVLMNPTNGEKQVRLKLGGTTGTVKLARIATLGVEVSRKFVPGSDPRQAPAPVEIRLFAPDGGIVWQDVAGQKTAEKGSRWNLTDSGASDLTADPAPPEWIDHEPVGVPSEQKTGTQTIESTLATASPVETQLLELFQSTSRREVKSLVARSSIHVGVFQPFIDALRDSNPTNQKTGWKANIDTLRVAMALSPDSASKVYQALVDQRGKPAANDLYEMLCGYSADQIGRTPEEMKNGAITKLINWLEDDSLDYRVMAAQDLQEITGKRLMMNPADKLPERTKNVKHWRTQLAEGGLKVVKPEN